MLHEAGHFLTARRFGMKATQFFVGFGPTLFSRHKGETEYGVKAIPAGGFVKIVGMTPMEEVEPGDEDRAFYKRPALPKTIVLSAGSLVHFAICVVLIFVTVLSLGVPDEDAAVLTAPSACLPVSITDGGTVPSAQLVKGECPKGTLPGVAARAGLKAGDRVLSAAGKPIKDYLGFTKVVRASAGREIPVVVQRGDRQVTLKLTPVLTTRPDLDDKKKSVHVGAIGVGQDNPPLKHVGFVKAFPETGKTLKLLVVGTWDTLTHKLGTITKVYDKEHRDPTGFVGVVGAGRVSGEVFKAPVPFGSRLAGFLLLIAGLNLFVGIFNLLPLLPLDGGHIAVVWFESVRDRIRRARGYLGEIQRVDYNKLMPVTFAVVILFAGFTLWLLGADIVNPIRLGQ
jgi:membrane-associated protease RseP (regulator of RpoE activity)